MRRRRHRSMNTPTNGPSSENGSAVISAALNSPTVVLCSVGANTTEATSAAWKHPSPAWPARRIAKSRRKSSLRSAPRTRAIVPSGADLAMGPGAAISGGDVEERRPVRPGALAVPADELLHHLPPDLVGELHRRATS